MSVNCEKHGVQFLQRSSLWGACRLGLACAAALAGCAEQRPFVEYSGEHRTARVTNQRLIRFTATPVHAIELGRVAASCFKIVPSSRFSRLALGNLNCSVELLSRAIDEKARAVGANALVGRSCRHDLEPERFECVAKAAIVAQPQHAPALNQTESVSAPVSMPASVESSTRLPAASTQLATLVDFMPKTVAPTASRSGTASEVPRQPASDLPLGQLRIVVAVPVSRDEVVRTVAVAARCLSAVHFESPRCIRDGQAGTWECIAQLYRPEWAEALASPVP